MHLRLLRYFVAALVVTLLGSPLPAQKSGAPPKSPTQPTPSSAPIPNNSPIPANQNPLFLYGTILTAGGASLPESTSIEINCESQIVKAIHPELNGTFRFDLRGKWQSDTDITAAVNPYDQQAPADTRSRTNYSVSGASPRRVSECDLRISAPGYQPIFQIVETQNPGITGVNAGVIVLTPVLIEPASAVSSNTLLVPKKARKQFDKGENDLRHNNLPAAARHLEKAVAQYGQFAAAWNDLGRIYLADRRNEKAGEAFSNAIAADPHFMPPYISLAELQLQESQFENAAATAGKALTVSPGLAAADFLQAVANFKLNRLDAAEQSARAAEHGPHQNLPQLHLLLADICLRKNDYSGAAQQMRSYLEEFPNGRFAAEVKNRLPDVERLATDRPGPVAAAEKLKSSPGQASLAELKLSLRMPDDSAYLGAAIVRITPSDGSATADAPAEITGETLVRNIPPGTYTIDVTAPGFLAVRRTTRINPGSHLQTVFIIMKPQLFVAGALDPPASTLTEPAVARIAPAFASIDQSIPDVQQGVACPLAEVVRGAGRRMNEFVQNLEKFDAREQVEHFDVDAGGLLVKPQVRTFDYVVTVKTLHTGVIELDEYRNGSVNPAQFPAEIATLGLPAMALIFHPSLAPEFKFSCEGLGNWQGHPAWIIHFAQRPDQPNRLRQYEVAHRAYSVPLRGRVWVDAGTYHVWHFESELLKPIPDIKLKQERLMIDYAPVSFHRGAEQFWLPQRAQVYWDWHGVHMYRRHTFSSFKLFEVSSGQRIGDPKQSYCFANSSNQDVTGTLDVTPVSGIKAKAVEIKFTIPAKQRVCKSVGPSADVNMPVDDIASAAFVYDGAAGSVIADAILSKESTLDLFPESHFGRAPSP